MLVQELVGTCLCGKYRNVMKLYTIIDENYIIQERR